MKRSTRWTVQWTGSSVLLALAACAGEGSDIGPSLPRLPAASCKVQVLDDQGRGVCEARVTIGNASALSGRNGRGDLFANPRGRALVEVDGALGAATAGDRLGSLAFAATFLGPDMPAVAFLPSLPDAASATLNVGTQATTTNITSTAGATLRVASGASVGLPSAATMVTLRVGDLAAAHVPGDLPTPVAGGALLTGRVVCVDPPTVTFAPAITLDVVDDLGLGSATATLFRLDPTTGEWTEVVSGLAVAAGRIAATSAIASGGTYVFAAPVAATAVTGRVLDSATPPIAVPDVIVAVDGRRTTTDRDGLFTVNGVPAVLANGGARSAAIELFAGGDWLPARTAATVAVSAGATAVAGDLVLDTAVGANVRIQMIRRGHADPLQPARLSTAFADSAFVTLGDELGQATFEDVPSNWIGFAEGRPLDTVDVLFGQVPFFIDPGRRWFDIRQFLDQREWFLGSRRARLLATDSIGGGPVRQAGVAVGTAPSAGFVGLTEDVGVFFADRDCGGRATASVRTQRDGASITSAYTIERPDGEHLELPLRRVLRTAPGTFDRHGLVSGTLVGADPSRVHRLRSTRRLDPQEWWDDVVDGQAIRSSLPIDVDPATTHGAFTAGVDRAGGHLAASELTVASGVATLRGIGLLLDLVPTEGAVTARDIPLDLVAPLASNFTVPQGVAGLDASIVAANLRCALALERPDGRFVDVVRDVGGNHAVVGSDLTLRLPPLTGTLAGHRWRVLLAGSGVAAGATLTQRSLLTLRGDGAETAAPLLPPPVLTAPAAGATVAASGFTVQYSLPANTLYATLELRSQSGSDTLSWQVLLPPDTTQFTFVTLPVEMTSPLAAGRTYTLTLSAFRASGGPLRDEPFAYRDLSTFAQSIGAVERGVDTMSSVAITITSS